MSADHSSTRCDLDAIISMASHQTPADNGRVGAKSHGRCVWRIIFYFICMILNGQVNHYNGCSRVSAAPPAAATTSSGAGGVSGSSGATRTASGASTGPSRGRASRGALGPEL